MTNENALTTLDDATIKSERLDLIALATSDTIRDWDLKTGQLWWCNLQSLIGDELPSEPCGQAFWESHLHPDDAERTIASLNQVISGLSTHWSTEYRFRHTDGSYADVLDRIYICRDINGKAYRLVGVMFDISTRKAARRLAKEALYASEARFRGLIEAIPQQVWTATPEGSLDYVNQRITDYFALPAHEILGNGWKAVVHPDDLAKTAKLWTDSLKSGAIYEVDFRLKRVDGMYRWHFAKAIPLRDEQGQIVQWFGTNTDITTHKEFESALIESEARLAAAQARAKMGSWRRDLVTGEAEWSTEMYRLFNCNPNEKPPKVKEFIAKIHPDDHAEFIEQHDRFIQEGDGYLLDFRLPQPDGSTVWIEARSETIRDANGKAIILTGTAQDITDRKRSEIALTNAYFELERSNSALKHTAHFDALTHLPNRVLLADRMQQAMIHTKRRNQILAVAFLDLDGFKAINDKYGHSVGDDLLITLSYRMKAALREGDTLARIGGDEFVAVLTDLEQQSDCEALLNRLLTAASAPIVINEHTLQISTSIGVTIYPQDGVDAEQLLRHADQAMYIAKQAGKNCYHLFDIAHEVAIKTQNEELEQIRHALENNEFILYYQPKVNMRTGAVIGAEALIRWQHPERGLLPPAAFLPIIEGHYLGVTIGEWVIATALTQMAQWRAQGIHLPVSVNISALQLQQNNFASRLEYLLNTHSGTSVTTLSLEILETSALEDISQVSNVIQSCRALGVSFALDDFGTGYSSLTYLKRLPAELLKIDQSFVRDMLDDQDDLAIIKGIIGLAVAFRREVIAEGVETVAHGKKLLAIGCELAQGYGIARPMPAAAIPHWIATWQPDIAWLKSS